MSKGNRFRELLTPANIVTTVRIILIPVFVYLLLAPWPLRASDPWIAQMAKPWIAAAVFALLALTDSLDGYLARSRNEVTTFGKFLDPLADKILVTAALLALIQLGQLPAWVALIIIARDFLVSGLRMVASSNNQVIAASRIGKNKTLFQIIAMILFIIKDSPLIELIGPDFFLAVYVFSWTIMLIALALTLLSMVDYFIKSSSVLGLPLKKKKGEGRAPDSHSEAIEESVKTTDDKGAEEGVEETVSEAVREAASELIGLARRCAFTIGTAESCTGGMIAAALTSIPGASDVYKGSVVSYANEIKVDLLQVDTDTLSDVGAVSETVALQMAEGARKALSVDFALSTTGVAGPGGGSAEKPVGTVWIGLAGDGRGHATPHHFLGTRDQIRQAATEVALRKLSAFIQSGLH